MYYSSKTVKLILSGFVLGAFVPVNMATIGTWLLAAWSIMGVASLLCIYTVGRQEAWLERIVDDAWNEMREKLDKQKKEGYNVSDGGEQ